MTYKICQYALLVCILIRNATKHLFILANEFIAVNHVATISRLMLLNVDCSALLCFDLQITDFAIQIAVVSLSLSPVYVQFHTFAISEYLLHRYLSALNTQFQSKHIYVTTNRQTMPVLSKNQKAKIVNGKINKMDIVLVSIDSITLSTHMYWPSFVTLSIQGTRKYRSIIARKKQQPSKQTTVTTTISGELIVNKRKE